MFSIQFLNRNYIIGDIEMTILFPVTSQYIYQMKFKRIKIDSLDILVGRASNSTQKG